MLFDRNMEPLREIAPDEIQSRVRYEEINGEHRLTVTTTRRLEEGWRALTVDGTGRWREWVVTECPQTHEDGPHAVGTYQLVWSLQYDLTHSHYHDYAEVGMERIGTAQDACDFVLLGQTRWTRGTCDADSVSAGQGCFSVYESAWDRLTKVVEAFGCEVDANISVSNVFGVTERRLNILRHVGREDVVRRFDWGYDISDITRTPDPGPYYCRVVPLGRGETEYAGDDETTFDWPLDITDEEPNGHYYIEDAEAAAVFRISDGEGGWIYPTKAVEYDEDDPELLLDAALDDLYSHTRPNVTYEANVVQLAQAGMDVQGVSLGDDVQCVDRGFNPDAALRIQGRVAAIEVDELSPETSTTLTIGNLHEDMASYVNSIISSLTDLSSNMSSVRRTMRRYSTEQYVKDLLSRINAEISATGGYAYLTEGEGIVTYDVAVADPLVGSEASQVVQIKGGSIRIASTKRGPGIDNWNFKTVIVDGHVLSELVTAAQLTSGYIGSAASGNYWNLDTGELRMESTKAKINGTSVGSYISNIVTNSVDALDQQEILSRLTGGYANQGLYINNGRLYINASFIAAGSLSGFKITENAIYSGTSTSSTASGAVAITSADFTRSINGTSHSDLRFAVGGKLAIAKDGKLYGTGVDLTGRITATSGEIGGFTIASSSIYNDKITLSNRGIVLKHGEYSTEVGRIGTNHVSGDASKYGLTFDLEHTGAYMTWAAKSSSSDESYSMKLTYANKTLSVSDGSTWSAGRLHLGCSMDFHYFRPYNLLFSTSDSGALDGVTFSTFDFALATRYNIDGVAVDWYNNCRLGTRNGIITTLQIRG